MATNSANAHAYGDVTQAISTALIGVTAPTLPLPTALPAGWYDLGWLDNDAGLTEAATLQETKKYGWQGGGLVRTLRSQFERPFTFTCLEENAVTLGLLRPGQAITTTAGTAEVQTVTFTGTGTAGTFALTLTGYGTASGLAYNIASASLQTALNAGFNMTGITASGSAGGPYTVTFPAAYGNVPTMTSVNNITGVTLITHATTTPGVITTYSQSVGTTSSQNIRQWAIDLVDGNVHHRFYIPRGEVTSGGDVVYKADDLTVYQFTLTPYLTNGVFYTDLHDNPALASGSFA